jgi:thiol-disulfide isomerase/thioredoxin
VTTTPTALTADDLGAPLGERLTLLQFSTGFCAPCRAARRVLERVVDTSEGVAHVEVDVADHAALATRFEVTATPLVLLLDPEGTPLARLAGVPTLAQARAAVAALG